METNMTFYRAEEYKVSWPRADREERRYSIKRSRPAAEELYHKLVEAGKLDVQFHAREVQYGEWKEDTNV
jgi:hypothetical protein